MASGSWNPWLGGPYTDMQTVTPSDSVDLAAACRGLYCTVAGNVKVTTADGTAITIAVQQYQDMPLIVRRIWSTGTTATVLACF